MSDEIRSIHLPEVPVPGKVLGRHVRHDPRSRGFPAATAPALRSATHHRVAPIFDQGNLGSCTGEAAIGCMGTVPFGRNVAQPDAVKLYSDATKVDAFRGTYPPTDTGSSGLAVMQVLRSRGWIKRYTHAFSLDQTLRALVLGPGIAGITWLEGCDHPDASGLVRYEGRARGGHEVELVAIDVERSLVRMANSWGSTWGDHGYFSMSFVDLGRALADHGDATFPER